MLTLYQIIYNARGSNRSWEWLTMVTVSIFSLREVIRRVQTSYKIPHNSSSHTSPDTYEDIRDLLEYLLAHTIQTYTPNRPGNKFATAFRDLLSTGAAYANTSGAFNNFRRETRVAVNHGIPEGPPSDEPSPDSGSTTEDAADFDLGGDVDITMDDLSTDKEEFGISGETDLAEFVAMSQEFIDELSRYD